MGVLLVLLLQLWWRGRGHLWSCCGFGIASCAHCGSAELLTLEWLPVVVGLLMMLMVMVVMELVLLVELVKVTCHLHHHQTSRRRIGGPVIMIHLFVGVEPKSNFSPFLTSKMTVLVKVNVLVKYRFQYSTTVCYSNNY